VGGVSQVLWRLSATGQLGCRTDHVGQMRLQIVCSRPRVASRMTKSCIDDDVGRRGRGLLRRGPVQVYDGYTTPLMSQCVTDEVDKWECRSPPTQVRITDSRRTRVSLNRFLRSANCCDEQRRRSEGSIGDQTARPVISIRVGLPNTTSSSADNHQETC
jgi:hypothetical protein